MSYYFLIVGACKKDDTYHRWIVEQYNDEEKAIEHSKKAKKKAEMLYKRLNEKGLSINEGENEFDPNMKIDNNNSPSYMVFKQCFSI